METSVMTEQNQSAQDNDDTGDNTTKPVSFKKEPYTDRVGFPNLEALADPAFAWLLEEPPLKLSDLWGTPYPSPYDLKPLPIGQDRRFKLLSELLDGPSWSYPMMPRTDLSVGYAKLCALVASLTLTNLQRTKPEALATLRGAIGNLGEDGKPLMELIHVRGEYAAPTTTIRSSSALAKGPFLMTLVTDGMSDDQSDPPSSSEALGLGVAGQQATDNLLGEQPSGRDDITLLERLRSGLKALPDNDDKLRSTPDTTDTNMRAYGDGESSLNDIG